jgi:hypothetical protein
MARHDTAQARRLMAQKDTAVKSPAYLRDRRPLAAAVHAQLGDYQAALDLLSSFEPAQLSTRGFDARWGTLARVRLLRASLEARLGHKERARQEYQLVLAQWKNADPALQPYVRMAQQGLAELEGAAG